MKIDKVSTEKFAIKIEINPEEAIIKLIHEIKKGLEDKKLNSKAHKGGDQGYYHQEIEKILIKGINLEIISKASQRKIQSSLDQDNKINLLPFEIKSKLIYNEDFNLFEYFLKKIYSTQLVSDRILYFYESKYKELLSSDYFVNSPLERTVFNHQIFILDLPSIFDKEMRLLILGHLLDDVWHQVRYEWSKAMQKIVADPKYKDSRKPKIIFIDEAHNIAPLNIETQSEYYIREKLRTIAAEGRKYGLFLFLISQRPDKLDQKILSECKNIGIMRLNNQSIIDNIRETFGLEEYASQLDISRKLKTGRLMLFGNWAEHQGMVFYGATRRTMEGGKKIPEENYSKP